MSKKASKTKPAATAAASSEAESLLAAKPAASEPVPVPASATADASAGGKKWKGTLQPADLVVGNLFTGLFVTSAILDVSLDRYYLSTGQLGLLASHYAWKEVTPVLIYINLFCTFVLLPLGLYNGIKEGYVQLFTRRASFRRHFTDFITITSLLVLVALNFGSVLPAEHEFSLRWKAPFDLTGGPDALAAAEWLHFRHWIVLGLNVFLMIAPFTKFGHPSGLESNKPKDQ